MTNHQPNDLSHLSNEEFNLLCPQGEHAPGPEPLSLAAQAVLDAYGNFEAANTDAMAAALRAAVTQVIPVSTNARQMKIRDEFLAVADELQAISS